MFDVFKQWRLDSGEYAEMAAAVVSASEQRCQQIRHSQGEAAVPTKPGLMNSNLSNVEHVKQVAR